MSLPWSGRSKTLTDRLEDLFVSGLAVLEMSQKVGDYTSTKALLPALKVVDSCWRIDTELRAIWKDLSDSVEGPLFWPEFSTLDNPADDELGKVFPVAYVFPNLSVSHMCTLYWSICIILWGGMFHLYVALATMQPPEEKDGSTSPESEGCNCTTAVHICNQYATLFDITALPPLQGRDPLAPAQNICQSFEYCIRAENKGIGAASIAFPLQAAIGTLKEYPGRERELLWARSSNEVLNNKGFRILKYADST
jgi:hypothetical protein